MNIKITENQQIRIIIFDTVVIFFTALIIYSAFLLPGAGWGEEARVQYYVGTMSASKIFSGEINFSEVSPVYSIPAYLWIKIIPIGTPAFKLNLLSAFASSLTLILLSLSLRLFTLKRSTPALAATSLAFSHSFFLHSEITSQITFASILFIAQIYLSCQALLSRNIYIEILSYVCAGLFIAIAPKLALTSLLPALFLLLTRWIFSSIAFIVLSAVGIVSAVLISEFGFNSLPILLIFSAFEFPVVGWLLILYGIYFLKKRFESMLFLLILAWFGSVPITFNVSLLQLFSEMHITLPVLAFFIGAGVEYLYQSLEIKIELKNILPLLLFISVILFPLVTTSAAAYSIRTAGIDKMIAEGKIDGIILKDNPWCDFVWYSFWPVKNSEGGENLLKEVEKNIPDGSFILADKEIMPVFEYARHVEMRLGHVRILNSDIDEQIPELMSKSVDGSRIFLCGIDPMYYDSEALGRIGEINSFGRFYEWKPGE